ncbi:MAG TPA: tRNA lysidine(34) synthetase TilS [Magnetovibrio sp.]
MPDPATTPEPLHFAEFSELMVPFAPHIDGRVAVAVSGGADSLALVLALAAWARPRNIIVTALTVDHGLRADSAAEARQVGAWLLGAGIEHHILTWTGGAEVRTGVQARARAARYALLAQWCRDHAVKALFVAHHQNDQAETFVMRLRRSSTLFGLAAMAPLRELHGVLLCRPLLGVAKARLEAALSEEGQTWVIDPSNANEAFERVRTRALLRHLDGEGVSAGRLAGAARAAGRLVEIMDRAATAFEGEAVTACANGGFSIDAAAFAALPQVLRERVVTRLLHRMGGRGYAPSPAKVQRLAQWMTQGMTQGMTEGMAGTQLLGQILGQTSRNRATSARTLGGCVVRCEGKILSIKAEPARKAFQQAKKPGLFAPAPLPRPLKSLTSRTCGDGCGDALSGTCAHTKY